MATVAATPGNRVPVVTGIPGPRYDHFFFSGMAVLLLAAVFAGFARTYYLAGMIRASLPSVIIHLHGAAFSCWILLLVTQTSLVAAGRVDIHRRLGVFGFLLACAMVVLGVLAGTDSLARGFAPPGLDAATSYVVPITDMLIFSTLIFFAFRNRSNPAAHKRFILIATIGLMIAAVARWPFAPVYRNPIAAAQVTYLFLLMLVGYDLWSIRKAHRATLWAGAFLIVVQQLRVPIGMTAAWHAFAAWAGSTVH
jgi:FtsH-binding integral membrane protein